MEAGIFEHRRSRKRRIARADHDRLDRCARVGQHPALRDRAGQVSDSYGGSFGTPAAIVLGARYDAGPFNHAEIDVMGTVGVNSALAGSDQQKLIDWAIAKWGV